MVNVEEIKQIVKDIEAQEFAWRQASWMNGAMAVEELNGHRVALFPVPTAADVEKVRRASEAYAYRLPLTREHCGTSCCVAGWAVIRAGYRVGIGYQVYTPEGKPLNRTVSRVGQQLLGLDEDQADRIFNGGIQTLGQLKQIITSVCPEVRFDD